MDSVQLLLTITLLISTAFFIAVGLQLFFSMRDFRKTLKRVNGILDTVEAASHELESGLVKVTSFFDGFQSLLKTLEVINLLRPLHAYLKRNDKAPIPEKTLAKPPHGIHALLNKMKDVSGEKEKKNRHFQSQP